MADIAKITLKGESEAKNFIDEALRGDIAYEELSTTVSKAGGYVAGDHLIYLGQYYEVVADIAQGGTIVTSGAGQNVEEREVGDEIKKNKTQVLGVICDVETSPATAAHSAGDQFYYDGALVEATSAIAIGDTIVVSPDTGYNVKVADKVVAQMQTLTNQANDMVNVLGSKNLLYNPPTSFTDNGLTFTTNDDGEVSIVGTHTRSSGNTNLNIFGNQLEVGTYKFSIEGNILGTCLILCTDSAVDVGTYKRLAGLSPARSEEEFTYTQADKIQYPYIWVQLSVNYTNVDVNTVYKPMVRLASITDDTYEPYAKTNQQLTDDVKNTGAIEPMLNVLGAKNIIPLSVETQTINGVTLTVQDDGSIVLNGTATKYTYIGLTKNGIPLESGKCILSGVSDGSMSTYFLFTATSGGATLVQDIDGQRTAIRSINGDSVIFDITKMNTTIGSSYVDPSEVNIRLGIQNGYTCDNVLIKPMIRLASITDPTYVPYAKTNQQLTEDTTALIDNLEVNGAVNMLPYPYSDSNKVDHGVTFIDNGDGTISVNGTASQDTVAAFYFTQPKSSYLPAGTYKLTVEGKVGGNDSSIDWYYIYNQTIGQDLASPLRPIFTYNGTDVLFFRYTVSKGQTVSTTLKPMITIVSYNGDYVPYAKSNKELSSQMQTLTNQVKDMNNVLGAKNLLPTPYYTTKGGTTTSGALTVTENADGSVTINGTASARSYVDLARNDKFLKAGTYILSGGLTSKQYVYINCINNGTYVRTLVSAMTSEAEFVLDYNGYDAITVGISIASGESLSNVTFYPMIRIASDPDNTYEPYAKTNQQLTKDSVTWDNISEVGAVNYLDNDIATQTLDSISCTHNDDESLTFSGTSTRGSGYSYFNNQSYFTLKKGTYKISKTISNADMYIANSGGTSVVSASNAIEKVFSISVDTECRLIVRIAAGATVNGTIYPMISPVSYNGPYVPYAKSNRELTDIVTNKILLTKQSSVKATADGTKTYATLLVEAITALRSVIGNLASNERLKPIRIGIYGLFVMPIAYEIFLDKTNTSINLNFVGNIVSANVYQIIQIQANNTGNIYIYRSDNGIVDRGSEVPTSGHFIEIIYEIYTFT